MADIIVKYHDELQCKLECDRRIISELSEELSFFVPGYKFMPIYKAGRWDGKKRLVDAKAGLMYKNHLPYFDKWCKENDYSYKVENPKDFLPRKYPSITEKLSDYEKYGSMKPHDYQEETVKAIFAQNQALVLSPTSSGKSYIIYLCIRFLLEEYPNEKIFISVPSLMLRDQLISDFKEYSFGKNWGVDANCQVMGDGMTNEVSRKVVICTWQTATKMKPQWFKQFQHCFVDEAHQADGKSISTIIHNLSHAKTRIGLTGTLDGTAMHELELKALFGMLVKKITTRELMDRGLVASLNIEAWQMTYDDSFNERLKIIEDYPGEIDFIISNKMRNEWIIEKAMNMKGNGLILFNFNEKQGHTLKEIAEKMAPDYDKQVYYITGEVKQKNRMQQKVDMETNDNVVLLSNYHVLSTGVSIKNINYIIFAHPFKGRIRNLQSIGRGLRLKAGKTEATLIDIGDKFRTKSKKVKDNHLQKQFTTRLAIYESEEFDYTMNEHTFSKSNKLFEE